jgi:hypothetical protein
MREQRFRALAVRLTAEDATAEWRADRHRRGELSRRAIAHARCLRHELIEAGINIVGELDFRDRAQAICRHADRRADDAALVDGCVEHAALAVLGL